MVEVGWRAAPASNEGEAFALTLYCERRTMPWGYCRRGISCILILQCRCGTRSWLLALLFISDDLPASWLLHMLPKPGFRKPRFPARARFVCDVPTRFEKFLAHSSKSLRVPCLPAATPSCELPRSYVPHWALSRGEFSFINGNTGWPSHARPDMAKPHVPRIMAWPCVGWRMWGEVVSEFNEGT